MSYEHLVRDPFYSQPDQRELERNITYTCQFLMTSVKSDIAINKVSPLSSFEPQQERLHDVKNLLFRPIERLFCGMRRKFPVRVDHEQ